MYEIKDLHVRLTSRCNLNCLHCYAADWFTEKYELDFQTVKSIITQAVDLGCEIVTFTGGEPLVHENIYDLIAFCMELDLKVSIETNGTLIDENMLIKIPKPDKISFKVSYDGEKMRDNLSADIVKDKLKLLVKHGFKVKAQTVITQINVGNVEQIFDFTQSLGIINRVFLGHSRTGNAKELPLFKVDELLKLKERLLQKYSHLTIELPPRLSGKYQKGCGWGVSRCEIMPNGDVTSCAPLTFARRDFIAGNIKENSLEELWNSKHFITIRELKQEQFKGICSTCEFWEKCRGSCRSISASIGGDILSPYPYCEQLSLQCQSISND
ncbi:radical SAM/SPASM domain-containing protein [Abyssisolibacter fermentans]|uniref:radical SAM/SPASM domain-containing protein n=1 Tax=Abyssisolibacter fermentans TaxID=1766203 RepID=UPI00082D449E|nr:radical SAM protein [Abyssisolibacter fermentans]